MRYFILFWILLCLAVVGILGLRYEDGGRISRKPPLELFPDMDRQPKLRPQSTHTFFADNRSSRLPVEGTVARTLPIVVGDRQVYPFEDDPVNTGRIPGTTNFVELMPIPLTEQMLARGEERYQISCTPCHGALGDGKGITTKYGMVIVANLHDARIVGQPDGEIFHTITHGRNLMGSYGSQIAVADRWAIVAYLRALQRSRLGVIEDVPAPLQATLK